MFAEQVVLIDLGRASALDELFTPNRANRNIKVRSGKACQKRKNFYFQLANIRTNYTLTKRIILPMISLNPQQIHKLHSPCPLMNIPCCFYKQLQHIVLAQH